MGASPNAVGLSRGHILSSVEASLKRLQMDYIDLYQIHGYDPATPLDETLAALDNLVSRGLVRYIGCSNLMAWHLMKALGISEHRGLARFESLQAYYSIASRDLEREIVPLLDDQQVGLMVWSPLAGGLLSGKFKREGGPEGARRATFDFPPVDKEHGFAIVDAMRPVAEAHGVSVARVALAWLLAKKAGDDRDHRRQDDRAARRQSRRRGAGAGGRRARGARRGQRAHAGISRLDGRAPAGRAQGRCGSAARVESACVGGGTWMAGSSPAMTKAGHDERRSMSIGPIVILGLDPRIHASPLAETRMERDVDARGQGRLYMM